MTENFTAALVSNKVTGSCKFAWKELLHRCFQGILLAFWGNFFEKYWDF